jgi:hypothetical protein
MQHQMQWQGETTLYLNSSQIIYFFQVKARANADTVFKDVAIIDRQIRLRQDTIGHENAVIFTLHMIVFDCLTFFVLRCIII